MLMVNRHGPTQGIKPQAARIQGGCLVPSLPSAIGLPSLGRGLYGSRLCSRAKRHQGDLHSLPASASLDNLIQCCCWTRSNTSVQQGRMQQFSQEPKATVGTTADACADIAACRQLQHCTVPSPELQQKPLGRRSCPCRPATHGWLAALLQMGRLAA